MRLFDNPYSMNSRHNLGGPLPRNKFWRVHSTWRSERNGTDTTLSKAMQAAMCEAAWTGVVEGVGTGTVRALASRNLCDTEGVLNPYAKALAVSLLPLEDQCEVLGLDLREIRCRWSGKPEPAALSEAVTEGEWGFADEGRMLHALIHALVLPRLYSVMAAAWNDKAGYDRARSWLYGHYAGYNDIMDVAPDIEDGMLADVRQFDRGAFSRSWQTLIEWNADNHVIPHPARWTGAEEALATLDAVGEPRLSAVLAQVFTDPYSYYRGWPDLMIVDRSGRCRMVEVKTTDRMHYSQIVTIPDMKAERNALGGCGSAVSR